YMGKTDSYKDAEVRELLAPLAKLAERYHVAMLIVAHLNKGGKGAQSATSRVSGSIGLVNAARAAFIVTKDGSDERRRLLLPGKNNLGNDSDGFAYRIVAEESEIPRVVWEQQRV